MKNMNEFTLSEIEAMLLSYPNGQASFSVRFLRAYLTDAQRRMAEYKVQKTQELVATRERPAPRQRKAVAVREEWEDVPCVLIREDDGFPLQSQPAGE